MEIEGNQREVKEYCQNRIGVIITIEIFAGTQAESAEDRITDHAHDKRKQHVEVQTEVTMKGVALNCTHYHADF
jgi:hypothetical protein